MRSKILLACGVLSSFLYVGTDVLGALRYEGYRYASQAVSELMAVGAPSKPLVDPLFLIYDVLVIAFGAGVCTVARRNRALRVIGSLLIGIGVIGFVATLFFPMNQRGTAHAGTDTPHVVVTIALTVCILSAIAFGTTLSARWFRAYSMATLLTMVVFGAMAAADGVRLAAQEPTPWLGVTERVNIGAYLVWVVVLALSLLGVGKSKLL